MIWHFRFCHNMPNRPTLIADGELQFIMPFKVGSSVHYLTRPYKEPLSNSVITMTAEIMVVSGDPKFVALGSKGQGLPANVRTYFDTGDMYDEFGRWWANPDTIFLTPGTFTVSIPLMPERWSSVYGKFGNKALKAFKLALKNVRNIGMTFGGGYAFGHGVTTRKGKAKFTLLDYSILNG